MEAGEQRIEEEGPKEGLAGAQKPREAAGKDAAELLRQSLLGASRGDEKAGLRAWLAVLDSILLSIEKAIWEARALAEETLEAWRTVQGGLKGFSGEVRRQADEVSRWPARIARLSSTGWMLTKVAGSYRLFGVRSAFLPRKKIPLALSALHRRNAERFYETSVKQGGAFLKIGQMLSARPDLLPESWVEILGDLQDAAPAESFEHVRQVIEQDLGVPLEERFSQFDTEPIAAASIGQVHRAMTLDGVQVAVKVQRPGISELVELDMALLELFLASMENMLPPTDMKTIVAEVQKMVRSELCYLDEAKNMARMAKLFEGVPGVLVPHPVPNLSSKRVLTSTFIQGRKITDVLDELHDAGESPEGAKKASEILGRLLEVYMRQVLQGGFFQADPHPGNFLVTESGDLVLLDFGCTKELPENFRKGYLQLAQAILAEDRPKMSRLFEELGFGTQNGDPDTLHAFADAFLKEFRKAAMQADGLHWPTREELFAQAAELVGKMQDNPVVKLPAEFVMLGRVFGTLGGLFMHYKPSIDYARRILPYLAKAL